MARRKTRDLEIVMHELIGLRQRVVVARKELLLVVVIGTPRENGGNVEPLAENLPDHVLRQHSFSRVLVMRATRGVHMMVAGIPAILRGIDPAVEPERKLGGALVIHREFLHMGNILGPAVVGDRVVTGWQAYLLAVGAVDLRLKEEVGRESLGGVGI